MGGRSCLPAMTRSIGHHALAHAQHVAASSPLAVLLALTQVPALVQAGLGGKCQCNPILFRLSQSRMSAAAELFPVLDMKAPRGWLSLQVAVTCSSGSMRSPLLAVLKPSLAGTTGWDHMVLITINIGQQQLPSSGLSAAMSLLCYRGITTSSHFSTPQTVGGPDTLKQA